MATASFTYPDFTLKSRWTLAQGTQGNPNYYTQEPDEGQEHVLIPFSLPTNATITAVTLTATLGNPLTGAYYIRVQDGGMASPVDFSSGTRAMNNPGVNSGTYGFYATFKANGSTAMSAGAHESALSFSNVTLTFTYTVPEVSYTVTAAVSPAGGGTLKLYKTGDSTAYDLVYVYAGNTVTLSPTPAAGYEFSGYTTTGGSISGNTLTAPAANVTVTANFTKITYTVTPAANPSGGGSLKLKKSGDKTEYSLVYVNVGDTVTLVPKPAAGYQLSSYTTTGGTISGNTLTTPAANVTVTANFTKISYTVTAAVSPSGGGTLTLSKTSATMGDTVTLTAKASTGYQFSKYTTTGGTISGNTLTMPAGNVTVTAVFTKISYTVTAAVNPSGGGTLTLSKTSATMGDTVTLTAKASTGYQFSSYTKTGGTISGNTLTMPAGNVTVTANFTKISYTITKASSPSGAGTVTTNPASSATMGTSVTVSQTPAAGYYFNGWQTSPSVTISNGAFTMPAGNITVTAKYLKRSTASLNATSMTGGASVVLTITTESTAYKHKYKLSFGSGMETAETEVAAGTTSVTISVPASWSSGIPNATSKTGGTLVLTTISGSTTIGTYTITGLTYNVPASAIPTIGTISTSILRTVGGTTYANVGNYYVQRHSGVSISTTGSGVYSSTITSMKITMSGYSGTGYTATSNSGSISLSSGLLTNSGTTTITVTATDSRGRTATRTATITVTAYQNPTATLDVWRVNSGGSTDPLGTYAKYSITRSFTSVGSNALEYSRITSQGSTGDISATTGDILPGSRQTFNIQQEYTISFAVKDAFETTTVTDKLPTGRFIIFASADGSRLGFMRATSSRSIPSGKLHIVEFSEDSQIYIGDETLEAYIRRIASS